MKIKTLLLCSLALGSTPLLAATCPTGSVVTKHKAQIEGGAVSYIACVGSLRVAAGPNGPEGSIYYTAYLKPGAKNRPIAFIWNGGPGGDSRLLHFHALGPKVWRGGKMIDNPVSPLGSADLIFIDPVGTGFSHSDSEEHAKAFYGTMADIHATTNFIDQFRKGRETSPLYLVGESFGTWRAAGAAEALLDKGVAVSGTVLISGGMAVADKGDRAFMRALSLLNRTATALNLGKLAPDLQANPEKTLADARKWAENIYAPALREPAKLDDPQRQSVIASLAAFEGLDPAVIDAKTLWVSPRQFRTSLMAKEGKTLGIFDMRQPSIESDEKAEASAEISYYRNDLKFTEGQYAGIDIPANKVGEAWRYDQSPVTPDSMARAMAGEGPPSGPQPWTTRALEKSPSFRVWVAAGLYDSLNSCTGNEYTVSALPAASAARISLHCYAGGHMMYEDAKETSRFGRDVSSFFKGK